MSQVLHDIEKKIIDSLQKKSEQTPEQLSESTELSIDQIRRDNFALLKIFRWEVVPTQILEDYTPVFPDNNTVWGTVVFADYSFQGMHRFTISPETESVRVILGADKIQAVENKEESDYIAEKRFKVYPTDAVMVLNIPSLSSQETS